jgi:spermidine/putrescine transport system ATP-binding protein
MDNKIVVLKNVNKEYAGVQVVDNINLYVKKGEFVTILGPSGCGKTTTLRMIAGFETVTSGEILLNGVDIKDIPPHKRPINTVFQRYALFPHLDVYDNVAFGLKLKKVPDGDKKDKKGNQKYRKLTKEEIDAKVTRALKIVDLEEFEWRDIQTLSGGQQQRVAIARAIVNEPEILLLDEPLGALDLKMRKEMQIELKEMHKKLGITFIYVTHDQEEALTMSDTIVIMKDGVIQQIGTPKDIYDEPKNAFVADFIGESNIYSGTIIDDTHVSFLGHRFECVDVFPKNEKVDVVIRPEDIFLMEDGKGMVSGTLVSKVFKGVHYEYILMVGKNEVVIQDTQNFEIDQKMSIYIKPFDIHIMKKEFTMNTYNGYIDKNNNVIFADGKFECDVTQLIPGSKLDEEGYLIGPDGVMYDLYDADVKVSVGLKAIEIIDNDEDGTVAGEIVSIIYKGDHYQVIIRTDEDEDFVVDTEYTWNEFDKVSVKISPENIHMKLVKEAKNYVKA